MLAHGIRSSLDDRNEKLGYRVREAQMSKVNYQLVVGDGEASERTVTIRKHGTQESSTMKLDEFIKMIEEEIKEKKLFK